MDEILRAMARANPNENSVLNRKLEVWKENKFQKRKIVQFGLPIVTIIFVFVYFIAAVYFYNYPN